MSEWKGSIVDGENIFVSFIFTGCCHPSLNSYPFFHILPSHSVNSAMAIGDGIGNGIEDFKVNEHDDGMGRGLHV